MKSSNALAVFLAMVQLASLATADVPQRINYQGRLTDGQGDPVPDGMYQIVFTIYESEAASSGLWYSGIQDIQVENGLFDYQLGSTNPLSDEVFADSSRWLGIRIVGNDESTPRTQLITVPYAYRVATVDGASGGVVTGQFEVVSQPGAAASKDLLHPGAPKAQVGAGFTVFPTPPGRQGSLHLLDGGGSPIIDLDGLSSSVGIGITPMAANLHVNGDIYTLGGEGDADLSGAVSVSDIVLMINYLAKAVSFTEEQFANADMDGDGRVTSDDVAILILIIYTGSSKADAVRQVHSSYGASPDLSMPDAFYVRGSLGVGTPTPIERLQVVWDQDVDAELGRGTTDTDITYLGLRNANGTKCYIYPNAAGNGIVVTTIQP
jgi:hypothetical protein